MQYKKMPTSGGFGDTLITRILGIGVPLTMAYVIYLLFRPENWPVGTMGKVITGFGLAIALMTTLEVFAVGRASRLAKCPIPVEPQKGHRVCFFTCFVPSSEDIHRLEETLLGMLAQTYHQIGVVHIYVLDEGDSDEVKALCHKLGVGHFSRKNRSFHAMSAFKNKFMLRTKYGNINSFIAWLNNEDLHFDFFAGVDCDHIPKPVFIERMIGWFRDGNVGAVVGPQTYENASPSNALYSLVARFAESCQFIFHSVLQPAGNRAGSPLFVGTNFMIRASALKQIDGIQPSVTEDALTSLALSTAGWKIVCTLDELAVGLGPATWRDMFKQQHRWSLGTNQIVFHQPRLFLGLGWRRFWHYTLMMSYYPTVAAIFILGVSSCVLYSTTGTAGLRVPILTWGALYFDILLAQIFLFTWNRRHNVSSMEPPNSSGFSGLLMASMCAPIYLVAFFQAWKDPNKNSNFNITPKGKKVVKDNLLVFTNHLIWSAVLAGSIATAFVSGHTSPFMLIWQFVTLGVCVGPLVIWQIDARRKHPNPSGNLEAQTYTVPDGVGERASQSI
ncbi:glycosyltransferase [Candidatus Saccharibacteria bacterium]|nr:glycosyltransferase [Candidatus Saccharibacteria bacterium]